MRSVVVVASVFAVGSLNSCSPHAQEQVSTAGGTATTPVASGLTGTYTFVTDGRQLTINGDPRAGGAPSTTTWEINSCGPKCSDVKSSLGWNVQFHLIDNNWQATREVPIDCGVDGETTVKSSITYAIDATSLTGTVTNRIPCGHPGKVAVLPATLTRN